MISISTTAQNPELRFYVVTEINTFNGNKNIEVVSSNDAKGMAWLQERLKKHSSEGYIITSQAINLTLVDTDGQGDWTWLTDDELHRHENEDDDDWYMTCDRCGQSIEDCECAE